MDENELPAPTIGEIGRALIKMEQSLIEIRRDLAETYVRKDVWQQTELAAGQRVGEVIKDVGALELKIQSIEEHRLADRRLWVTAIIAPIIVGVAVGLIIFLVQGTVG